MNADYARANEQRELLRQSQIKFVGELSLDGETKYKSILDKSTQIFLLGAGYHEANMNLLGFDFQTNHPGKIIAGTGLGLGTDGINSVRDKYPAIDFIEETATPTPF